jgi:hypothetical protein
MREVGNQASGRRKRKRKKEQSVPGAGAGAVALGVRVPDRFVTHAGQIEAARAGAQGAAEASGREAQEGQRGREGRGLVSYKSGRAALGLGFWWARFECTVRR